MIYLLKPLEWKYETAGHYWCALGFCICYYLYEQKGGWRISTSPERRVYEMFGLSPDDRIPLVPLSEAKEKCEADWKAAMEQGLIHVGEAIDAVSAAQLKAMIESTRKPTLRIHQE